MGNLLQGRMKDENYFQVSFVSFYAFHSILNTDYIISFFGRFSALPFIINYEFLFFL